MDLAALAAPRAIHLTVNGEPRSAVAEPRTLLVHLIRESLGLKATNVGCDTSSCGACTIMLDGQSVKWCTVLAVQAEGCTITTVEGISDGETMHPMQRAFHASHALQCGFCTPGMVMAAIGLLDENPHPTAVEVRHGLEGNICRCTGYQNIVEAVMAVAQSRAAG